MSYSIGVWQHWNWFNKGQYKEMAAEPPLLTKSAIWSRTKFRLQFLAKSFNTNLLIYNKNLLYLTWYQWYFKHTKTLKTLWTTRNCDKKAEKMRNHLYLCMAKLPSTAWLAATKFSHLLNCLNIEDRGYLAHTRELVPDGPGCHRGQKGGQWSKLLVKLKTT